MTKKALNISVEGPTELTDIKLTKPQNYAAGIGAVKVALQHAIKEMGLSKSIATLSKLNQEEGIDCPGCAWPDPEHRSPVGEFCENGAKAIAEEATNARVDIPFFEKYTIEEMSEWTDFKIGKSGRITDPMILREGSNHYKPISWNDAFEIIGKELNDLEDPNQALFYTSGRSSNEAAFLYGLFIRMFGTNNMPDCSNMCHESSGVALDETLGIGKGSVTLEDFEYAEAIMVIGQNPGTNHPRMLSALQKCKENGGKVISINPLKEAGLINFKNPQEIKGVLLGGADITDVYLQVKINQDVALLKLITKRLLDLENKTGNVFDKEFIAKNTNGYDDYIENLNIYSEDELLASTGLNNDEINKAVKILAASKKIIICWAMGLTQHKNGVENIKECVNLLLLKGSIGIKGGGTCPVRGHSNVQGDRTVGITHHVSEKLNNSYQKVFNFSPPTEEGLDVVKAIKAMHDGDAKVFISLGGNFLSAASDTLYTGKALRNCNLTVSVSTKFNRTHLVPGKTSIILPTLGRTEVDKNRFVTVENSMGRVHRSKGRIEPASDNLMSEPEIIAHIAHATLANKYNMDWLALGKDYDLIREKVSLVFDGFDNYTERSQKAGFDLPNHTRRGDFSELPNQSIPFSVCNLPVHDLEKDDFLLMSIRSHDQYNTTIYGMDDRYRGVYNERRVVFINPKDMESLNLKKLDKVDLVSNYEDVERLAKNFLVVPYNIPQGNLAAYYPETNVLIPNNQFADKSYTPISKSVKVKIKSI
ncbi:FdhF/YdeP family oxidoreductase [Wenyingzhuangia sp. IMCC45533]